MKRFRMLVRLVVLFPPFLACGLAHAAPTAPGTDLPSDYERRLASTAAAFHHATLVLDDGTRLAYHIREGNGPALVLIPGSWDDYLVFSRVMRHLDPALRVIVVELRGHGDSGPAIIGGTMESFADDVLKVIDHLGLKHYYLGGHSIGGMLAIEIAGRAPKGLAGAIPIEGWSHYTVLRSAFGSITDYTPKPEHAAEVAAHRARGLARLTEAERADFGGIWRKWDGNTALRTTPVPVLSLWGDRGHRPVPRRETMQIPARDNIQVTWIADASHSLMIEQPEAVATAINGFIEGYESAD